MKKIITLMVAVASVAMGAFASVTYTRNAVVSSPISLDETLTIAVSADATVVYSGMISGSAGIVKDGAGTLILSAENSFAGGVVLNAGTLMAGQGTSSAFGSGAVTVNATGDKVCRVAVCGGTMANDITFAGSTSAAYEGLYVDGKDRVKTFFTGAINASGDLHLKTSCDYGEHYGDYEIAEFTGSISVASPGILAGAPHYLVNFNCPITADVIKGYWAASALTQDGGNHGAFKLSSTAIVANRAEIDQTRFVCGAANVFSATSVKSLYFTCEHKKNSVGCVDVNGFAQNFRSAYFEKREGDDKSYYYMSGSVGVDEEGAEIVNSSATKATVTIGDSDGENHYSHNYVRMNGYMDWVASNKQSDFSRRKHDLKGGSISLSSTYFRAYEGSRIAGLQSLSLPSGSRTMTIDSQTDADIFPDLKEITINNCTLTFSNADALANLSKRGNLELTLGASKTATGTSKLNLPTADSTITVRSLTVYGQDKEPGLYTIDSALNSKISGRGRILVLGDAFTEMKVVSSDTSESVSEPIYWGSLALSGSLTGYTFEKGADAAQISLSGPLTFGSKAGSTARVFEFATPLNFVSWQNLTIPSDDTLVLGAGSRIGAPLTSDGPGALTIRGPVRIDAELSHQSGDLTLEGGVEGLGSITSTVARLKLKDADVRVPMSIDASEMTMVVDGDCSVTNHMRGKVTLRRSIDIYGLPGKTIEFDGGIASSGKVAFYPPSNAHKEESPTFIIHGFSSGTRNDGYLHANNSARLIVDASGATVAALHVNKDAGRIELIRDDFFSEATARLLHLGCFVFSAGRVDLHRTHQFCSHLGGSATLTGEYPAAIEVARGQVDGDSPAGSPASNVATSTLTGACEGSISIIMNGVGEQTLSGVSSSTGGLVVKQGVLRLTDKATWKAAREVKVQGGSLVVEGVDPFGKDVTSLTVEGTGLVSVARRMCFATAKVQGSEVSPGSYTTAHPGPFAGHLVGTGTVVVGRPGLMVVFR